MRKAISILLVFVMCLSLLPANAIAKDSSRTEQPLSTELNKGSEIPGTAYQEKLLHRAGYFRVRDYHEQRRGQLPDRCQRHAGQPE